MSTFFSCEDLFEYIANELNYSQNELVHILGTSVPTVTKWKKHEAIPSQEMYRKMLHFAKLMGVDCDDFTIEMYIESVLTYVYDDNYSLVDDIDFQTNRANIQRNSDFKTKWVELELLTNKKVDLF